MRLGRPGPRPATACSAHCLLRARLARRLQMGAQAAQEARLALLELGVGRPHAGDDPNELRESLRKYGQRHQRQDEVFGVEVPVQMTAALRVAEALGRLDPRLAALVLG